MPGIKIDNFSVSDVNLTAIMDTTQALRQGHFKLTLSEMDTDIKPEIKAGSIIDLSGSLIYFDADQAISGTPADGTVYVKIIYSGGVYSAEFTTVAPVFDTSKNGWYGVGLNSNHRYIAKMQKTSSSYTGKILYDVIDIPYKYETKTASFYGSWSAGGSKVITLTYSSDIEAITSLNIESGATGQGFTSTSSIVISGKTATITLVNRTVTISSAFYYVVCTAAL